MSTVNFEVIGRPVSKQRAGEWDSHYREGLRLSAPGNPVPAGLRFMSESDAAEAADLVRLITGAVVGR